MANTAIRGGQQIMDGTVLRDDLNTTTTTQALIRKLIQGTNMSISSTGVDSGTGDVTVNLATTLTGLTSVTSTTFVGALTGNASTATNSTQWNGALFNGGNIASPTLYLTYNGTAWGNSNAAQMKSTLGYYTSGDNVSFGTGSFGGLITSTLGNNTNIFHAASATTGYQYIDMQNTSGHAVFALEGSTANNLIANDLAYSTLLYTVGNTALTLGTNLISRLTIDGSGNVLIGNTSSIYTSAGRGVLEINGSSNAIMALTVAGAAGGYLYHTGTNLTLQNAKASGTIDFSVNAGTALTLNADRSATFSLSVFGPSFNVYKDGSNSVSGYFTLLNAAITNGFNWQLNSGSTELHLWSYISGTWANKIQFTNTGAATFAGAILTNGALSADPGASYTVLDHAGSDARIFSYGANTSTNGTYSFISKRSNASNPLTVLVIDGDGNVGVGTTSPAIVSGYTIVSINNATNGGLLNFKQNGTDRGAIYNSGANMNFNSNGGGVIINTNGTQALSIASNQIATFSAAVYATQYIAGGSGYSFPAYSGSLNWQIGSDAAVGSGMYIYNSSGGYCVTITAAGAITANTFYKSSDMTLKTLLNKSPFTGDISTLEARYYLKDGKEELGYFAQDAQKIMSYAVSTRENGLLDLDYTQVLVAKMSSVEDRIKQLETEIKELKNKL